MRVFLLLLGCLCPFLVIGAFIAIGMVAKPHTVRLSRSTGDLCENVNCGPAFKCVLISSPDNVTDFISRRCVLFK
ncbi:hypothetical protein L596_013860 [Steinernema carpocapsae]|uniref:Uncharacterized protein n=1 Tax=Steinernema carpocapsae TaxID=34508 RepID=A0A4U5P1H3_STECR|nr:hypothetical protein L596_013860 [Steinernema carpocapsae]